MGLTSNPRFVGEAGVAILLFLVPFLYQTANRTVSGLLFLIDLDGWFGCFPLECDEELHLRVGEVYKAVDGLVLTILGGVGHQYRGWGWGKAVSYFYGTAEGLAMPIM